jgi:23S rRNA (adenine-N6)-dimethyltransferase
VYKQRRKELSQVFLHSPELVKRLIGRSSIEHSDLVIEIGPGEGVITTFLIERAKTVIAIERDPVLYSRLKQQFRRYPHLNLVRADFLSFQLPNKPYKIFANIPFSIEGKIVRKLIDAPSPPEDCYLILRKEVAERLAGIPRNGQFSILHKPWFHFEIFHRFKRSDFTPKPRVESVMLRFVKRQFPLLPEREKLRFQQFIISAFGGGRRMQQNLSRVFPPHRIQQLRQQLRFGLDARPTDLSLEQWISLYRYKQHGARDSIL